MTGPVLVFSFFVLIVAFTHLGLVGLILSLISIIPLFINFKKPEQLSLLVIVPTILFLLFSFGMRDADGPDGMGLIFLFGYLSLSFLASTTIKVLYTLIKCFFNKT